MSIEAKFKKSNDKIADYEVSLDGLPSVSKGRGAYGRSQALSALDHFEQVKAQKSKYLKALETMERKAAEHGSLALQNDPKDGIYHSAVVDGELLYEGYDIDELNVRLTVDRAPSEDRQGPGF